MVNAGAAFAVERSLDLPFGAGGNGFLGLFRDRTSAAGADIADHEGSGARVAEAEGDIQLLSFRDLSVVPGRIQPPDRGISRRIRHGGGYGSIFPGIVATGDHNGHQAAEKQMAHE